MGAHFLLLEELDGLRPAIEAACLQIHLSGGLSSRSAGAQRGLPPEKRGP
jgi:hypothetical protein